MEIILGAEILLWSLQLHLSVQIQAEVNIILKITELALKQIFCISVCKSTCNKNKSNDENFNNCLFSLTCKPEMEKMPG